MNFDYIKDNRRISFSQVTTGHQSHMLEFVRKQGCLSQVAGAGARLSSWKQRVQPGPHLVSLLCGH